MLEACLIGGDKRRTVLLEIDEREIIHRWTWEANQGQFFNTFIYSTNKFGIFPESGLTVDIKDLAVEHMIVQDTDSKQKK